MKREFGVLIPGPRRCILVQAARMVAPFWCRRPLDTPAPGALRFPRPAPPNAHPLALPLIHIHYRRLPDREEVFRQWVVEDAGEYVVTLLESADLREPMRIEGRTVLEPGSPIVWFTYREGWHDVGRFHLADGTFTGVYANVLTPVRMEGARWETTDLCLDVWLGADGRTEILDQAEFAEATDRGWMDAAIAATAREQAETLAAAARQGSWPPAHVREWDLARARARLHEPETPFPPSGTPE